MNRTLLFSIALAALLGGGRVASAQVTVLGSFDPADVGGLCGVGLDPETSDVWVYDCSAADVRAYSPEGTFLASVPRPGESTNDVDVTFAPEELVLGATTVPSGTLLFINGESEAAEIYALDKATGSVLDTLATTFGVSHVVGGAYHPTRHTFFLVQDNVPGSGDENTIAEVDPASGETLQTFQITDVFTVSFGDLDVSGVTGNLFVVSEDEDGIAEFTPEGDFVEIHPLPTGASSLSGIALDCAANEAWVSNTSGVVSHLGQVPCGTTTSVEEGAPLAFRLSAAQPNPVRGVATLTLTLDHAQAVAVAVFDGLGRHVALLHDGPLGAGAHVLPLDAAALPGGVYVVRAMSGAAVVTQRLTVVR